MQDEMGIGEAVEALKAGHAVTRRGWNGRGMFLVLMDLDKFAGEPDQVWYPFVAMYTVDKKFVPGLCSQTDLLATDWCMIEAPPQNPLYVVESNAD